MRLLTSLLNLLFFLSTWKPCGSASPTVPLPLSSHAQTSASLIPSLPLPTGFFLGVSLYRPAHFHFSLLPLLG